MLHCLNGRILLAVAPTCSSDIHSFGSMGNVGANCDCLCQGHRGDVFTSWEQRGWSELSHHSGGRREALSPWQLQLLLPPSCEPTQIQAIGKQQTMLALHVRREASFTQSYQ